ncbi:MAG: hypothetical protein KY475_12800 [Planctomycetes bacterium]|nr:hypothetical protein [Planctomycetota bacterium]
MSSLRRFLLAASLLVSLVGVLGPAVVLAPAGELYVAPNGQPDASGTKDEPTTLLAATQRPLEPGSTVLLLDGNYIIKREAIPTIAWQGRSDARITLRSAPGQWARIDGGLIVQGAQYVTLRDFEVYRTRGGAHVYEHQWGRPVPKVTCGVGAENHEYKLNGQLIIAHKSRGLELINLYLHDNPAGGGIGAWNPAEDMLTYGCLLIRNGCDDRRRGHGHGAYIQNGWPKDRHGESTKIFRHNISAYNHSTGMKSYGETPGVRSTHFLGNIFFGNGMTAWTNGAANYLAGSIQGPMEDIVLRDNHFYQPDSTTGHLGGSVFLGFGSDKKIDCTFTGNYVFGGGEMALDVRHWRRFIFQGNTVYDDKRLFKVQVEPAHLADWEWRENTCYLGQDGEPVVFNGQAMDLDELRETTGLADSPRIIKHKPAGVQNYVIPNEHDPDRVHIALYNWDGKEQLSLDLGGFLRPGESYVVYSALDYRGEPLAQGTHQSGPVNLALPEDAIVGRQFHALVVHRVSPK